MQAIAQHAARSSKVIMKYRSAEGSLETIYRSLDDTQKVKLENEFARLYLQFYKPPKASLKNKNPLAMLAQFAAKNDTRDYLNYMYVTETFACASNGHYLLKSKNTLGIEPGFYDTKLLVKVHDSDFSVFPKFDSILAGIFKIHVNLVDDVTDIVVSVGDGKKKKPSENYEIGGYWYLGDYIKKMISLFPGIDANINSETGTMKIETDDYIAILMPQRN